MTRSHALAALSLVCLSCGGRSTTTPSGPAGSGSAPDAPSRPLVQAADAPDGLELRLSPGKQGPPAFDRAKLAPARKLAEPDVGALLGRAKPIAADSADRQAFALRPGSQPPPKTGQVVASTFPPAASAAPPPPASAAAELRVVRFMPEGKVPLAPQLSVTFSQPMIAVTSQADAAANVPVKLTPTPKGAWRWIGTRTVVFDPEVRFPQATTYTVEIPAGTKSATGATLKQATRFTFETPAPALVASYPSGSPQRLDVPMLAMFDQKIDPAAILPALTVKAGGKVMAIRALEPRELAANKQLQAIVDGAKDGREGRWVAFRAAEAFAPETKVEVEIRAGAPSAEGPNKTPAPQRFEFETYAPLKVERSECGWSAECRPGMAYQIVFNNPIDVEKFEDSQVSITPALPDVKLIAGGNAITVMAATAARTRYKIVVSDAVLDEFGQRLGKRHEASWNVGDAVPTMFGADGVVVLDPSAKRPTFDVFSTNYDRLKVALYAVTPADYDAYARAMRDRWNYDKPPRMPGRKVFDDKVAVTGGKNQLAETHIDLAPALGRAGLGHVIAVVEPSPWTEKDARPPQLIAWLQSTKLGIDAHLDSDSLVAFASELDTGKRAGGVALELSPYGIPGTTDDQGMATLALAPSQRKGAQLLIARRGDDVAFVADDDGYWSEGGSWFRQPRGKDLAWYVVDDRKLYRPGEEVSLKGWLRILDHGKGGDIGGVAGSAMQVSFRVTDAQGAELAKGTTAVNPVGGFDAKFTLPKTPNLGYANIEFQATGGLSGSHSHAIQVEEFRRPEFSASAQASQGPFFVGGGADVTLSATYFAGGPLAGAPVTWEAAASQTSFAPPGHEDFVFGAWTPWWAMGGPSFYDDDGFGVRGRIGRFRPPQRSTLQGTTDATGSHTLHLDFLSAKPSLPMSVTVDANVTDVNRQPQHASAALLVHPASLYVGLKAKRPFIDRGAPYEVEVIGVDLDGKPAPGAKIDVQVVRVEWQYKRGKYATVEVDPQSCAVVAAAAPRACMFQTTKGGSYKVTATIRDAQGRANETQLTYWVSGGEQPPAREVAREKVELVPDKKEYSPGNTAELLVMSPFFPAEGVVTWRRSGIVKIEKISLDGPTKVITVPITDALVPNLTVQVDLVGVAPRTDDRGLVDPKLPKRPAYAVGTIDLSVPPRQRTLKVEVAPKAAKLAPGERTTLALAVTDAAGRPVADAEAAVIVVDEAVLSLTGYQFANPIDSFYGRRSADVRDVYSQAYIKLAKPSAAVLAQTAGAPGGGAAPAAMAPMPAAPAEALADAEPMARRRGEEKSKAMRGEIVAITGMSTVAQSSAPIAVRSNFNPLAAFSPTVKTDAAGKAVVEVKLPDNVTRYRVVAIAVAGEKQFGKGESAVTARLPLVVRPSPPRFLNFGDTFKLPVVVQNQTDAAMTVRVAVRATNAALTDGAGREVTVPANDRVEVQFPAAAELAGTARFQIVGAAGALSDAAELALPVWTPATTEAFATYGVIDDGAVKQPVALPGKVVTTYGGLEVTTASTNLQAVTDAVLYLVHYPFECAEQRSSRILAIAALKDVLGAFQTKEMPTAAALSTSVAADVERIAQMQNGDGGFAYWQRGYRSEPYLSVYVASALGRAAAKGFDVKPEILDRAKGYLRAIEGHYPSTYSKEVRWAISAFALYTRKQLGDLDVAKAKRLVAEAGVDKLSMEANGWLLGTLAQQAGAADERKAIVRHALNRVSETAGAANFTTGYGDGNYLLLASDRRVDGVMLDALIQEQKDLDLIPKLVTGLLAQRKAGRWLNTQENTYALLALDRYFQTYEKATPDFVARLWLGNDYAGEHAFKGRTTETHQVSIAMKDVASHDKSALTIQKDGKGRLYYRVGMRYAPADLSLAPADHGFVVERRYEGVDDPKDVTQGADGIWHIKAGARVRVKLTMVNENRRYHVALVDPLPAGLEPMNPALATTGPVPADESEAPARGPYWWWYGPWYEHQNLRDERVEAFAQLVWEGVHAYSYVARATTPGNFVVPPTKAEEMYMPETFGRSHSDRVVIE